MAFSLVCELLHGQSQNSQTEFCTTNLVDGRFVVAADGREFLGNHGNSSSKSSTRSTRSPPRLRREAKPHQCSKHRHQPEQAHQPSSSKAHWTPVNHLRAHGTLLPARIAGLVLNVSFNDCPKHTTVI